MLRVSVHNSERPGLPWGRGKTGSCLFFREAAKGLRQPASIKGSSGAEGVEKLRWVEVAQTPWNLRNFPLLSHFLSRSLEGESTRAGPQAHPCGQRHPCPSTAGTRVPRPRGQSFGSGHSRRAEGASLLQLSANQDLELTDPGWSGHHHGRLRDLHSPNVPSCTVVPASHHRFPPYTAPGRSQFHLRSWRSNRARSQDTTNSSQGFM